MDLKAAFDSVDRGILGREMRKRGVRERLVRRCEDIFRKTRDRVRIGEGMSEAFWRREKKENKMVLRGKSDGKGQNV